MEYAVIFHNITHLTFYGIITDMYIYILCSIFSTYIINLTFLERERERERDSFTASLPSDREYEFLVVTLISPHPGTLILLRLQTRPLGHPSTDGGSVNAPWPEYARTMDL